LIEELATIGERHSQRGEERAAAFGDCLEQLPADRRQLILERYSPGGSVQRIAADTGRSLQGLSVTLHRIRQALLECVERKLGVARAK